MYVAAAAPGQWRSVGEIHTTSTWRMGWAGCPSGQIQPRPAVTCSTWPYSCVCQYVRAPGEKNTELIVTLSVVGMMGSPHTTPVNVELRCSETLPSALP